MKQHRTDCRSLLTLAVLAACTSLQAQEPGTLQASVDLGLGTASGDSADRALFGQYNGLRTRKSTALLGGEFSQRHVEAGTSIQLSAVDLLGPTRELRLGWKKQGDWKVSAQYSEAVRDEPLAASNGADLRITRTRLGVDYAKTLGQQLQLEVKLASENRKGARLFGIGYTCPSSLTPTCRGSTGSETGSAVLMLAEPIDARHSQIEARLSFGGEQLNASVGYHGSFYSNAYGSLQPNVPSSLNNALGTPLPLSAGLQSILNQPVALPPDNQAHQLDVAGTYAFTPTTRLNFMLAYARALQHQDFAAAGFTGAPAGSANLGGRIDTTLAQVSLSARPLPQLSLLAKLRFEERDDKTPLALYNLEGTTLTTNRLLPSTKWRAQLQANYPLTSDLRGSLGADFEAIDRGAYTATSALAGVSALRQKTNETGARAELRRRMNENFSGAIALASSRRTGSNWLRDNSGVGVTEVPDASAPSAGLANAIFLPTLADRQRDTIKLLADWQPSDELALQLSAQTGQDRFNTPSDYGLRKSGTEQFGLDASYAWSERWRVNVNVNYGHQTLRQARPAGVTLDYDNLSSSVGLGLVGKPVAKVEFGINLSYVDDRSAYIQLTDPGTHPADAALLGATGGLPKIVFRQAVWTLFGRYEIDKRSELRLDLVHQLSYWSDWTWAYNGVPFSFSDGTTISQKPRQNVTFIGVRYLYRWL